jgi:hypothetical protein
VHLDSIISDVNNVLIDLKSFFFQSSSRLEIFPVTLSQVCNLTRRIAIITDLGIRYASLNLLIHITRTSARYNGRLQKNYPTITADDRPIVEEREAAVSTQIFISFMNS